MKEQRGIYKGARLYEWENEAGERFRVVVDNPKSSMSSCDNCTATHTLTNQGTNATSIAGVIISFYKNPKVQDYYAKQQTKSSESTLGAQSQNKIRRR